MFHTQLRALALAGFATTAAGALVPQVAVAKDSPGLEAIEEFREGRGQPKAVENRFFLKEGRFEIAPMAGYVPNNSFSRRYVFGADLNYHFTETLGAEAVVSFSPDAGTNDLKGLVPVLLDRAYNASGGTRDFQQPLDKVTLAAAFGVSWAPLYGKINLVGETVLNFDFYLAAGVGMVSKTDYFATYNEEGAATGGEIVSLEPAGNEVKVGPNIGMGMNFFLTQMMALKIDARSAFFVDNKPQYNPDEPVSENRVYNNFTTSVGLSFFVPKMKPRLYNF